MENKQFGKKAESLINLKKEGLFDKNLLILPELPSKDTFFSLLEKNGFKESSDLAVRFSSAQKNTNLPRSIILSSFEQVYNFVKENLNNSLTAIIHDFVIPKFSGTLTKNNNQIYISLINGAWEISSSKNCDEITILGDKAKILFNPHKKECLFVNKDKLEKKIIQNNEDNLIKVVKTIFEKLNNLNLKENLFYEFIVSEDNNLTIMEYKDLSFNIPSFSNEINDYFEIKEYGDIDKWDKHKDIVLSLIIEREEDEKFLKIAEYIKRFKDKVYVKYGLCSHPAILLREEGLMVVPFNQKFQVLEISLN